MEDVEAVEPMAGEIVWVSRDLVQQNPFAPLVTKESMMADLAKIGTVKHWIEKFGRMFGHDASITDNVARLVTEGVKKWDEEDPSMEELNNMAPGATPATWWIYLNADNNKDKELYAKLAICAQDFHPFVSNEETTRRQAAAFLKTVKNEMIVESVLWTHEQQQAYGDYAGGAGPIAG
jgi:hypothetical protein